ncbi:MAG: 2-5 ligase [Acidobacteria bacterium]|nr:2-5 ligase [Acidobacteriota bacterium]
MRLIFTPARTAITLADDQNILRIFCAIELPTAACARATEHIKSLREQFSATPASWNRDGRFHLTVKFVGEIPQNKVERLSLAAQRATVNLSPFKIIVAGAGVFPKKGPPKVLWLGIDDLSGGLTTMHTQLDQECAREGFGKQERAFHPHLTIARVRSQSGARELAAVHEERGFAPVEVPVSELLVIRSELGSAGAKYTTISKHPLTGKG